jgi:6-phosphofructokinase 2
MPRIVTFTPNPAVDVSTSTDKLVDTRKLRCGPVRRDPGGGGINVARVIKRLAGDVLALYPAGGATGRLLQRLVEQEGILSITVTVADETREDFTVREEETGLQYRFVMPGPCLTESEWQACLDALGGLGAGIDFIVASGSLPGGVPEDFYARAARQAARLGTKFVLDSSGPALAAAMTEPVFLIKPNLGELSRFVGGPLPTEEKCIGAARRFITSGQTEIVALTLGHRGALLVTRDRAFRAPPLDVKVESAVGAGDSFLGGMVFSLARGSAIEEAFRYGIAAGSAALLSPGTQLCRADDVEALYEKVIIEPA